MIKKVSDTHETKKGSLKKKNKKNNVCMTMCRIGFREARQFIKYQEDPIMSVNLDIVNA